MFIKNKKNIKKIYLFIIVFFITLFIFYIFHQELKTIGKTIFPIGGIPIESIDVNPPNCKVELKNNQISDNQLFSEISIRYNVKMNTNINPTIELLNKNIEYNLEESNWIDNSTFYTKITIEDKDQEETTYFVVSDAQSTIGAPQMPFYSETHDIFINVNTIDPKLKKITINSNLEDIEISLVQLEFDTEIYQNKELEKEDIFLGLKNSENLIFSSKIYDGKKTIELYAKPKINSKDLENLILIIKENIVRNQYKNLNSTIDFQFNDDAINFEFIEPIITPPEPPTIVNNFKITEFEIEPTTNRAIVTFSEGVYSSNNSSLNLSNFEIKIDDEIQENYIKKVSHIVGDNKITILFNKLVSDYTNLKIICNNVYNSQNELMIPENSIKMAQNIRTSLPIIKGWNLINIPSELEENWNILSNITDNTADIELYKYIDNQWIPISYNTEIIPGALFIHSTKPQELLLSYDRYKNNSFDAAILEPGWNLIGFSINPNNVFFIDDIITNIEVYNTIIVKGTNYNATEFNYVVGSNETPIPLSPYEGYWIYIEENTEPQ